MSSQLRIPFRYFADPPRGRLWIRPRGFTLIELLVVVGVIALLISILLPTLGAARQQARSVQCLAHLHVFGQGMSIYVNEHHDGLPPGRLPKIDDCNSWAMIYGRVKYRPTFLSLMSGAVGLPPFSDPKRCKTETDMFDEAGDRQNYEPANYVCPSVAHWTDERNGAYGYNYHFLGNSRLLDSNVHNPYKNWPVLLTQIRYPGRVVMIGDCMGTAAAYAPMDRWEYANNARDAERYGNEGFNLDPPRIDPVNGEIAGYKHSPPVRSAADPRHRGKTNILWVDGHAKSHTLKELGYVTNPDGSIGLDGDNASWSTNGRDVGWTPSYRP